MAMKFKYKMIITFFEAYKRIVYSFLFKVSYNVFNIGLNLKK